MSEGNLDILIMCDNSLNIVGGEQESTKILLEALKNVFALGIISPGIINKSTTNIRYYELTKYTRIKHLIKKPMAFFKYFVKIRELIINTNPRIIHTQAQVSFFIVAFLKKMGLISQEICIIHTERGLYTKYNVIIQRIFLFFMNELNMFVVTTNFNMKYWKAAIERKGITLKCRVIENTAGQLFANYDQSLCVSGEERLTIGFAGRYCSWKNWPLAVEISLKINEIMGEKLYVKMAVGCLDENALRETTKMFETLQEIFRDRFDGKINIDLPEMEKFYYDIDIFMLTSNYNTESFGRTLVEAMSRKTIVLTTDAGGSVEVVGNSNNVCFTANEFVEKVIQYANDHVRMDYEKEINFQRVKEIYSLENNISKHNIMYEEILGGV